MIVIRKTNCANLDLSLWNGSLEKWNSARGTRHNGMCSTANHKRKQEVAKAQKEQELQDSNRQDTTYSSLSYTRGEVETQTLDRNSAMDL
ncbi:hypothetical protein Glove_36g13 [Diversispora epigaea]|uniref:Uncharacterized protein n=1 Tax=Diversispora epigaea TaxID=1348612 RepID=A0A397JH88_9GLOM|nr:hypothetical protein Glove_36g13 [Diversispora epigaea]